MTHLDGCSIATRREKTADARDHLLNYISFLLHMAPLLRRNILCPVTSDLYLPETEGKANARWTNVRDLVATELKGDDFWDALSLDEFIKVAPEDVKRSWERELRKPVAETGVRKGVFLSSSERVGRALSASANAQDRLTTYFPFRYDVDVLFAYQRSVSTALSRNLPDYDNWLLSRLIDVELPDLGELQPNDVVQIRTDSSEFADWRKTLADAVIYADNAVPAHIWGRNEAVRREISNRLHEGKVRLEASLTEATVGKVVKKGSVAMVSGRSALGSLCWSIQP
jgi:hypothetical protein